MFNPARRIGLVATISLAVTPTAWAAIPLPLMQPGPARPWQAQVPVSTYSSVNTFNGNLFTALPLFSWSGRGPDMDMVLYHNSTNWNQTAADSMNVGFFLGPGWSMSYSDQILDSYPVIHVHADGTRDSYTWNGQEYIAQSGVYNKLSKVSSEPDIWRVTRKDQSYMEFLKYEEDGIVRLERIVDAVGNETQLQYEYVHIPNSNPETWIWRLRAWDQQQPSHTAITAAGRAVYLKYDDTAGPTWGRLLQYYLPAITNPAPDDYVSIGDRYWTLAYGEDGSPGWLTSVNDPLTPNANRNEFKYVAVCNIDDDPCPGSTYYGRLASVTDKFRPGDQQFDDAQTYLYTYISPPWYGQHRVQRVCDPGCTMCNSGCANQRFTYAAQTPGYIITRYFDRRNAEWKFQYNDSEQNLYYAGSSPDGNLNITTEPLGASSYYHYYSDRNATDIIDGIYGKFYYRTFDSRGNLLEQMDGEAHTRTWTYDSLNNVTSYTDPLGNATRYCYEKTGFPTLLTRIIEPDDSMSPVSPASCSATGYPVTAIDYFTGTLEGGRGQIKEVIDPNGVWTGFEYDAWGQQRWHHEGRWETQTAASETGCSFGTVSNGGGFVNANSGAGGNGGSSPTDETGNAIGGSCTGPIWATTPTPQFVPEGFPRLPCSVPALPRMCAKFGTANGGSAPIYYPMGQLRHLQLKLSPDGCSSVTATRDFWSSFDGLNRQLTASTTTDESGSSIQRQFSYTPNWQNGTQLRTGPDGVETLVQYNTANRVASFRRGPAATPIVAATYSWQSNTGILDSITYGNGMVQSMQYASTSGVTQIKYVSGGNTVMQLDYEYTADDLPSTITESGTLSGAANVAFTYDARRRLTREVRKLLPSETIVYDITYVYDKGGNRTQKIEAHANRRTDYFYDRTAVQHGNSLDSATFKSNYNRLEYFKVYDTTGGGNSLQSTTWYYYTRRSGDSYADIGSVTWIVTHQAGTDDYTATRFGYGMNDRTLSFALGESWEWDGDSENCPTNYDIAWAREFRNDGARQRYLNRQLSTTGLLLDPPQFNTDSDTWTDYDGDDPYGDYSVTGSSVAYQRSYEPGTAVVDPWISTGNTATDYFVTDHLGTTRGMALPNGSSTDAVTFSAFGEKITGTDHRFGYVGEFGYQAHAEMPYLHVGHRYYDPGTGRFLQRDPIGIYGGVNVYAYVRNSATTRIDPNGLHPDPGMFDEVLSDRERRELDEYHNTHGKSQAELAEELSEANWFNLVVGSEIAFLTVWTPWWINLPVWAIGTGCSVYVLW